MTNNKIRILHKRHRSIIKGIWHIKVSCSFQLWSIPSSTEPTLCRRQKNGLVYLHPSNSWVSEQISGHVDVVYRHKWGSYYRYYNYYGGSPYKGFKTEIYH